MTPTTPQKRDEQLVTFAADQPQYLPLQAYLSATGVVTTEWTLTDEERAVLLAGGRIRLQLLTFNQPLQPIMIKVVEAPCSTKVEVH